MSNKHTPGPWSSDAQGMVVLAAKGEQEWPVAVHIDGWTADERNANAQLIAAAPDLLEACEALLEQFVIDRQIYGGVPESQMEAAFPLVKQARAAIAKAKGE